MPSRAHCRTSVEPDSAAQWAELARGGALSQPVTLSGFQRALSNPSFDSDPLADKPGLECLAGLLEFVPLIDMPT